MNYYSMMQAGMTGDTSTSTTATKPADSTTNTSDATSATPGFIDYCLYWLINLFLIAINPSTGQPDYSQQWIEYYRSIGQNDFADEIVRQMKDVRLTKQKTINTTNSLLFQPNSTTTPSTNPAAVGNPWAGYGATTSNTTNGSTTS
jgi:hypothetical protein